MRILLIEPDKVLATTYRRALEEQGHTVSVAYDAQTAINVADATAPELLVLELQLIEHNGIEFLYEFRSYPEWQLIPVLIHTWVPLDAHMTESLKQLHVIGYHYKPQTSLRRLLASIDTHTAASI
jgi:DNA-binding response OmpR family regulator